MIDQPEQHPDDQQDHPEPAQVEVLPPLRPKNGRMAARQIAVDAQVFAGQAAEDDHRQGRQQDGDSHRLAPRLAPGDQRGQEDPGRQVRRGHEEDGHLEVPGAGQVVGEEPAAGRCRRSRPPRPCNGPSPRPRGSGARTGPRRRGSTRPSTRWAGVRATSRGRHEPDPPLLGLVPAERAANSGRRRASTMPMPPSRATSDRVLHMIASPVTVLPTSSSGGQLLVYEYVLPGRRAVAVQAVQAMKAVTFRDSSGSAIRCGLEPLRRWPRGRGTSSRSAEDGLEGRDLALGPDQGAGRRVVAVGLQLAADPLPAASSPP